MILLDTAKNSGLVGNGKKQKIKMKCKCVKGIDGFTWGETYDVKFAGRVWWAVNDDGKKVCGASETFEEC